MSNYVENLSWRVYNLVYEFSKYYHTVSKGLADMYVKQIIDYMCSVVSLLSVISVLFVEPSVISWIIAFLGFCSFAFLIGRIFILQNKMESLQTLARKNHVLALKLLLTYDRLSRRPNELLDPFKRSPLIVSKATYAYKVYKGKKGYDVVCKFTFEVKKANRPNEFHVFVLKSRGSAPKKISYKIKGGDDESFSSEALCRPLVQHSTKKDIYKNFTYAMIPLKGLGFSGPITKLTVRFRLENAFNFRHRQSFILCPFLYAKKIDTFDVSLDFSSIDSNDTPKNVTLKCYPYNGYLCGSVAPQGLNSVVEKKFTTKVERALSKAVYILEIQGPDTTVAGNSTISEPPSDGKEENPAR